MEVLGLAGAALLALAQVEPQAAPIAPGGDPNTVDEVVVTGKRTSEETRRKAASDFVRGLSAPSQRGRLARWSTGLCPGIVGLPQARGAYVADRIAEEAQDLGLKVGEPGCRADAIILFTSDPDRAAREFLQNRPTFFAARYRRDVLETGGGGQGLPTFLESRSPVRWWHVARLATSDGTPVGWGEINGVKFPVAVAGTASRLSSPWKEDLSRALIIVDSRRMAGITYEQLASYLALVTLAQLEPDGRPGPLASITTLFADRDAGRSAPDTLTENDRAYLKGLYAAPADVRSVHAHRGAIRRGLIAGGGR